jgi:hypothetical protein
MALLKKIQFYLQNYEKNPLIVYWDFENEKSLLTKILFPQVFNIKKWQSFSNKLAKFVEFPKISQSFGCKMTKNVEKQFTTIGTYFINIDVNLVF